MYYGYNQPCVPFVPVAVGGGYGGGYGGCFCAIILIFFIIIICCCGCGGGFCGTPQRFDCCC